LWPLQGIKVLVSTNDRILRQGIDETFELEIRPVIDNDGYVLLTARTVYGALRGLQTLLQVLEFGWLEEEEPVYIIPEAPLQIIDAPTYPYRGLLIDTSRHYLPLQLILENLDAMEMNKLNVLHWHLTDSQSWPFQSTNFPELSQYGAFCKECIYTTNDIQTVVSESALRGIRVCVVRGALKGVRPSSSVDLFLTLSRSLSLPFASF
jgi:hexosaminidase